MLWVFWTFWTCRCPLHAGASHEWVSFDTCPIFMSLLTHVPCSCLFWRIPFPTWMGLFWRMCRASDSRGVGLFNGSLFEMCIGLFWRMCGASASCRRRKAASNCSRATQSRESWPTLCHGLCLRRRQRQPLRLLCFRCVCVCGRACVCVCARTPVLHYPT